MQGKSSVIKLLWSVITKVVNDPYLRMTLILKLKVVDVLSNSYFYA